MSPRFFDGQLLYFAQDAHGELRVLDDGTRRLLSFGPGDEQSACLKADPAQLLFEYTQAMLLALLFCEPRKVLCLGLGAGSLLTALQKQFKGIKITAVELRQAVIDIACDYFWLPRSKRIQLHCADAFDFVAADSTTYDLVFCDLYTVEGASPLQRQQDFLAACARRLKPEGLLVLNCWRDFRHDAQILETLSGIFADIRVCATSDGNWVILAAAWQLPGSPASLRTAAQAWSQKLGYSLNKHLNQLERHA